MSKILITTHGTTGDVLPFLRLAREFMRRGHKVTFAVNPGQTERASQWGVPSVPVGPSFGPENVAAFCDSVGVDKRETTKVFPAMVEHMVKPFVGAAYHDFLPLVAEHDVVVYSSGTLWAAPASSRQRKP